MNFTPETNDAGQAIDDDTGQAVVYPTHIVIGGNAYWLEFTCPGNQPVLMGAAVNVDGTVDWQSEFEVEPAECVGAEQILVCLMVISRIRPATVN